MTMGMEGQEKKEFYRADGKRISGRSVDEMRPVTIRAHVLENAPGSCYLEWGNNKVIAAAYGPRECHPRHLQRADRAIVRATYNMCPFSVQDRKRPGPDRRSQEISKVISEALEHVVITEPYPRTAIDVFMEVLQADAGTRCAALTAASVAIADAGIPMTEMISAVAAGKVGGKVVLDLDKYEDNAGEADMPMGITSRTQRVVLMQMDGNFTPEQYQQALDYNFAAAAVLHQKQGEALRARYQSVMARESEPQTDDGDDESTMEG